MKFVIGQSDDKPVKVDAFTLAAMEQARERIMDLREQNEELKKQIYALPAGQAGEAVERLSDDPDDPAGLGDFQDDEDESDF